MKKDILFGVTLLVGLFIAMDLPAATYGLTGTWNYQLSGNWATGDIGCAPGPDAIGTCTINQSGDTFTFVYTSGVVCDPPGSCTFEGTVNEDVYSCSTTEIVDDEGGTATSTIVFTAASATSATGTGSSLYTHPSGKWQCSWGNQITLTKAADSGTPSPRWVTIRGEVTYNGTPVCAMVLANGQYMFTCKPGDDFGKYELDVPLDANGEITIQAFVSGLAPFRQTTDESDLTIDIDMQATDPEKKSPDVTTANQSDASTPANWERIIGTVSMGGSPLCAMVLANGQHMFSCGANDGVYDLTVPLDGNGQITLFVFVSGMRPYKQTFTP